MEYVTIPLKEWNEIKSKIINIEEGISKLVKKQEEELLTPGEVCKMLGIGRSTYQRHVEAGLFTQIKIGKNNSKVKVMRSEIDKLINEGKL